MQLDILWVKIDLRWFHAECTHYAPFIMFIMLNTIKYIIPIPTKLVLPPQMTRVLAYLSAGGVADLGWTEHLPTSQTFTQIAAPFPDLSHCVRLPVIST